MRKILACWLSLGALAWSQPVNFVIPVTPADVQVYEVKKSGDALLSKGPQGFYTMVINKDLDSPRQLRIKRDGYNDYLQDFSYGGLSALPLESSGVRRFPAIVLVPQGSFVYLFLVRQKHWVLLGCLVVGVWLLRRWQEDNARKVRLAKIEEYASQGGDPMVGRRLGEYLLTQRLGSGGMATVYRGVPYDSLDEFQAVAIKIILDEKRDPEFFHRFRREVEVTKSLNHPNTLRLFDWGEEDGHFFLVMELVQGAPLTPPPGGFSLTEFRSYLPGLLAGLLYAHDQGIVHRDLKPDNLMVMSNGQIKVMDFGLARSHEMKTVTATGTALGTPAYMPPEQILGHSPTPLSDQYSLGVTFYEMLCGRRPFEHEELMALIQAQLHEEAMPPSMYREDIPLDVEQVVMQMMCKQPERRFRDLRAVQLALEAAFP